MSKLSQIEIAQRALSQMNLTPDEKTPNKKPFVNNSELAAQLKIGETTVYNTRRSLKFAREKCIHEDCHLVYAWRWDKRKGYAKIGRCPTGNLLYRIITTYEPVDKPLLIGVRECRNKKEAGEFERCILNNFKKVQGKRDWVIIKPDFEKKIKESFKEIGEIVEKSKY